MVHAMGHATGTRKVTELLLASAADVARLCQLLEAESVRPLSARGDSQVQASLNAHREHARCIRCT